MTIELKIPQVGESITEVQVGEWLKAEGSRVKKDDPIVVIETDKVTVELPAPVEGTVSRVLKHEGEAAKVGEVIGFMEAGAAPADAGTAGDRRGASPGGGRGPSPGDGRGAPGDGPGPSPGDGPDAVIPSEATPDGGDHPAPQADAAHAATPSGGKPRVTPAARRILDEHGLSAQDVVATGPGGRILKENVLDYVERKKSHAISAVPEAPAGPVQQDTRREGERQEEIVPMSPLRRRIAERLVQAQAQAALLTTFNEIDMSAVLALRKEHGPAFQEKYGIKLGFMSFFVKASIEALKLVPGVNAEVRGSSVVYRNYYDIGVAVGGGRGLVVPVLRSAERMSFAEIEIAIHDFAVRARENALKLEELQGGTFTISNGGIYGSMLSTPIVNPPQSGILGMHAIQERPIAREGQVLVRPMMYVALTYDHRIVDGREAVSFLVRIKECIENPARMLLEV